MFGSRSAGLGALAVVCVSATFGMATRAAADTVDVTLIPRGQAVVHAPAFAERVAELTIDTGDAVLPVGAELVLTLLHNERSACVEGVGGIGDNTVGFAEVPIVTEASDGEDIPVGGTLGSSDDCYRARVYDEVAFTLSRSTQHITISMVLYNVGPAVSPGQITINLAGSCLIEGCDPMIESLAFACPRMCSNASVEGLADLQPAPPKATAIDDDNVRFDVDTYNVGDGPSPVTTVNLRSPWDDAGVWGGLPALAPGEGGTTSFTLAVPRGERGSVRRFTVTVDPSVIEKQPNGHQQIFDIAIPKLGDDGATDPTTSISTTVTTGGGKGKVIGDPSTTTTTLTIKEKVARAKKAVAKAKAVAQAKVVALRAARDAAHRRHHALPAWIRPKSDPSRVLVAILVLALATVLVWRFVLNPARHAHDHKRPPRLDPRLTVNWSGHRRVSFLPTPHPAVIGVDFDLSKRTIAWKKGSP